MLSGLSRCEAELCVDRGVAKYSAGNSPVEEWTEYKDGGGSVIPAVNYQSVGNGLEVLNVMVGDAVVGMCCVLEPLFMYMLSPVVGSGRK